MAHGHERSLLTFFANICESMALGGQITHPIGFYVKFRVCKYLGYVYVYIYMYIRCIYVRWEPCTPSTEIPSQMFHIYM